MLYFPVISAPQTLTGSWTDIGAECRTDEKEKAALWLDITMNDSANFRIRVLGKLDFGATDEYFLPIFTVSAAAINIQDEYSELSDDVNQKIITSVILDCLIPTIQWQIQVGTVGAAAAVVNSAYMTWGRN